MWEPKIYYGICVCGHEADDHHGGIALNEEYMEYCGKWNGNYRIPEECEYYGFNEDGGKDEEGNDHCHNYVDIIEVWL